MFHEPRKVMRLPQVMAVTGWSRSTVYDKIKSGKFPKPFKPDPDGRVAGWSTRRSPKPKVRYRAPDQGGGARTGSFVIDGPKENPDRLRLLG